MTIFFCFNDCCLLHQQSKFKLSILSLSLKKNFKNSSLLLPQYFPPFPFDFTTFYPLPLVSIAKVKQPSQRDNESKTVKVSALKSPTKLSTYKLIQQKSN